MDPCPHCRKTFKLTRHLEKHLKKCNPLRYEEYKRARADKIRDDVADYRSHEDARRVYRDFATSMDTNTYQTFMTTTAQDFIDRKLFRNHAPIESEYDNYSSDINNIQQKSTSGQSSKPNTPIPPVASAELPDDPALRFHESPTNAFAGLPACGPQTLKDMDRDANMLRSAPAPFRSESHYNLAEWLVRNQVSQEAINDLLHESMPVHADIRESFRSSYTLHNAISEMQASFDIVEWEETELTEKWPNSTEVIAVYRRNISSIVRLLLAQKTFKEQMVYAPVKRTVGEYDDDGDLRHVTTINEIYTAKWWKDQQETIREGGTVVPLLLMSDATHLTNFSGDKKVHPIYLTIGNISTEVRAKPRLHAIQPIALLPTAPKRPENTSASKWREMRAQIRRVRDEAMNAILLELTQPEALDGMYAMCADGHYRACYLRLAGWTADYPEHIEMLGLQSFQCPWCEVRSTHFHRHWDEFGSDLPNRRDHHYYADIHRQLTDIPVPELLPGESAKRFKERMAAYQRKVADLKMKLKAAGVNALYNPLWRLHDCNIAILPKPDKLHTLYLGMVNHLMSWISELLHQHGRTDRFMALSARVPAYLNLSAVKKSWQEVSQWTGKESKQQTRYLYAVLSATLAEPQPNASEKKHFVDALAATKALMEICLYLEYKSHTEETLSLLEGAIRTFFVKKETFKRYRAGKVAKGDATERRTELIKEREAELESYRKEGRSTAFMDRRRAYWADIISNEMDEVLEDGAHFNLPKLHMLLHFVEQIRLFGNMAQFDSGMSERAHKEFKDGYRKSNRNSQFMAQVLNRLAKQEAFALRNNWRNSDAIRASLYGDDDGTNDTGTIPLSQQQLPAKFHGCRKELGKGGITTVFDVIQASRILGFDVAWESWVKRTQDQAFSTDKHLRATACMYNSFDLHVEVFASEDWERQRLRAVPNRTYYGATNRSDWAWIRVIPNENRKWKRTGRPVVTKGTLGALRGRIPVRLLCLFKVNLFNSQGKCTVYSLVLAEVPFALDLGKPNSMHQLVTVIRPDLLPIFQRNRPEFQGTLNTAGQNLMIFGASALDGAAHCIPLQTGDIQTSWVVNPHIDLRTWNWVWDEIEVADED